MEIAIQFLKEANNCALVGWCRKQSYESIEIWNEEAKEGCGIINIVWGILELSTEKGQ